MRKTNVTFFGVGVDSLPVSWPLHHFGPSIKLALVFLMKIPISP